VVEAARLCSAAEGGQILCSQLVRAVAGRHVATELVDIGPLDLKGLSAPLETVEVRWEPDPVGPAGVPLPARLAPSGAERLFAFHGRGAEREAVDAALKQVAAEAELQVVLLSGEPGIGKTALTANAARSAHALGWTVLLGSCTEGLGVPHEPWIGALGHLLAHRAHVLGALGGVHQRPVRRLLPQLEGSAADLPEGADPTTERLLLHEGVRSLLAKASSEAPIVVVLDDVHWADVASLQLLERLVRCREGLRVVLLVTFRDSDVAADSALAQLLANLHRGDAVQRIRLGGLNDDEVVELVEVAAGGDLTDDGRALAHVVRRESGGNPFFLGELLRHIGEADLVVQDEAGRYSLREGEIRLPTSVREVVGHRVGRLGDEAKRLLSVAAVIGREFDVALLAEVAECEEGVALDVLERARAAAIVSESPEDADRFRFAHALVAHTLEAELAGARRRRIHERVAMGLEARQEDAPAEPGEIARHWLAAARPTDPGRALQAAQRAGDVALAALAPSDACHWYEQALELVPNDAHGDRCRLLTRLAAARWQAAQPHALDALLAASRLAIDLGDPELLVGASLAVWDTGESVPGRFSDGRVTGGDRRWGPSRLH
jgi:predicted ATPase